MTQSNFELWKAEEQVCVRKLVEDPGYDVPDHYFRKTIGWLELIKTLRALTGASLIEAQTIAIRHRGWRRWLQKRVDYDPHCAKEARLYLRAAGSSPFLTMVDGCPRFAA